MNKDRADVKRIEIKKIKKTIRDSEPEWREKLKKAKREQEQKDEKS